MKTFERSAPVVPGVSVAGLRIGDSIDGLPEDEQAKNFLGVPYKSSVLTIVFYRDVQVIAVDRQVVGVIVSGGYKGAFDKWLRIGTSMSDLRTRARTVNTTWMKLDNADGLYISLSESPATDPGKNVKRLLVTSDKDLVGIL